jgi:DNA-binding transcriptional MerR regulator
MNIGAFSALTGLTPHTLRYYEQLGLLKVARAANGHRHYSVREQEWMTFIARLKATGMPLKQILHYAQLRAQGEETHQARQALLEAHAQRLRERLNEQQCHLAALEAKIAHYQRG